MRHHERFIVRPLCALLIASLLLVAGSSHLSYAAPDDDPASKIPSTMDEFQFRNMKLFFSNQPSNEALKARLAASDPGRAKRANWLRKFFVKTAGHTLFLFRRPYGAFIFTVDKVVPLLPTRSELTRIFKLASHDPAAEAERHSEQVQPNAEEEKEIEKTLSTMELADKNIADILAGVNKYLVDTTAIVASSAEQGVTFSIGLQRQRGAFKKLGKGSLISLDVYVGYNRDTESLVISLFPRTEKYKRGVTASIGVSAKVQYYWMTKEMTEPESQMVGLSIYPPGSAFGSLVYEQSENGYASLGIFALVGADFSGGKIPLVNELKATRRWQMSIPIGRKGWIRFFEKMGWKKPKPTCESVLVKASEDLKGPEG